ncbi:unnamed protein product [Notodromas monacha]|uniref:Uncharacterized protein n=1 Tax=Notodromas monacha TaxID=399045 RepID=A0A7R9G8M5_9CRUS|nr:unnamed protein product [Notodromas monacha]CAG0912258.1 unnamed protein product [Notodromas monacha]
MKLARGPHVAFPGLSRVRTSHPYIEVMVPARIYARVTIHSSPSSPPGAKLCAWADARGWGLIDWGSGFDGSGLIFSLLVSVAEMKLPAAMRVVCLSEVITCLVVFTSVIIDDAPFIHKLAYYIGTCFLPPALMLTYPNKDAREPLTDYRTPCYKCVCIFSGRKSNSPLQLDNRSSSLVSGATREAVLENPNPIQYSIGEGLTGRKGDDLKPTLSRREHQRAFQFSALAGRLCHDPLCSR